MSLDKIMIILDVKIDCDEAINALHSLCLTDVVDVIVPTTTVISNDNDELLISLGEDTVITLIVCGVLGCIFFSILAVLVVCACMMF